MLTLAALSQAPSRLFSNRKRPSSASSARDHDAAALRPRASVHTALSLVSALPLPQTQAFAQNTWSFVFLILFSPPDEI